MTEIGDKNEASEAVVNGFVMLFLCVLALCMIMNHYIGHKFHLKYLSEAGAVVIVGLILSGIVALATKGEAKEWLRGISPTVFFIGFLPPIIFNSGYTLRRKVFLYYFVPIVLYAVVGTFMSSIFVGLTLYGLSQGHASYAMSMAECLAFGSLISSTDPVSVLAVFEQLKVEPLMFYLVFGESVLNDAVALVLFNIFSKFVGAEFTAGSMAFAVLDFLIIFIGSMVVGFLFGCASALLFKYIDIRHSIYEMGVYLLLAYIPSLFSASIELSGIVTILFTGMFSRHYTHQNLSVDGQTRASFLFSFLAMMSETAVFLELGLSVFSGETKNFHPLLIFWTFILILIGRAINVYPISYIVNRFTSIKVAPNIQHMLWFAGLRGAMAYACSKEFPNTFGNQPIVEVSTMVIVLLTVFGFGTFTITMLEKLKIPLGVPATDAVSLSENQSKILALEEKYLLPFLKRPTEFSGQQQGHGDGDGDAEAGLGGSIYRGDEPGQGRTASMEALEQAAGEGSFIDNEHIDGLFGYNRSMSSSAVGQSRAALNAGGANSSSGNHSAGGAGGGSTANVI